MAKLLAIMVPEPGHIIPTMHLAQALAEVGHITLFATFEQFHEDIREGGFDCVSIERPHSLRPASTHSLYSPLSFLDDRADITAKAPDKDRYFLSLLDAVRKVNPDLVLIDRIFAHMCRVFDALQIRYVIIGSTFNPSVLPLKAFDLKSDIELMICPKELADPHDLIGHNRYFFDVPFTRNRPAFPFPWEELDTGRPLVYCTFGTQVDAYVRASEILKDILRHLANSGHYKVVAVIGSTFIKESMDFDSSDIVFTHCAPQLELLERATLVISHGGIGTIKEAIQFAVPMFLIPFAHDQFANAYKVASAGFGHQLDSNDWSCTKFRTQFTTFERHLPQLRENLLTLADRPYAVAGQLSKESLGELINSILQSGRGEGVAAGLHSTAESRTR